MEKGKNKAGKIIFKTIIIELVLLIITGMIVTVVLVGKINTKNENVKFNSIRFGLLYNEVTLDIQQDNFELSNYMKSIGYYDLVSSSDNQYKCKIKWIDYIHIANEDKGFLLDYLEQFNEDTQPVQSSFVNCTYNEDFTEIEIKSNNTMSIQEYSYISFICLYDYNYQRFVGNVKNEDYAVKIKVIDNVSGSLIEEFEYPKCKKELEKKINTQLFDYFDSVYQDKFNQLNNSI